MVLGGFGWFWVVSGGFGGLGWFRVFHVLSITLFEFRYTLLARGSSLSVTVSVQPSHNSGNQPF